MKIDKCNMKIRAGVSVIAGVRNVHMISTTCKKFNPVI